MNCVVLRLCLNFLIAISVTVNLNLIVVSIYLSSITNEKNLEIDRENASI